VLGEGPEVHREAEERESILKPLASGSDIVLAYLSATPGEWVADLYLKTRTMVHSRIADLRARGYEIESKCFGKGDWRYRLITGELTVAS
jgi:biotin operon repressor